MRNETAQDLAQELLVAEFLSHQWGCTLKKITEDRLFLADFAAVHNGRVAAFVEIRCRSCSRSTYPTIFLPLHKMLWADMVFNTTSVPYVYVVRFDADDVIAYKILTGLPRSLGISWVQRKTEPDTHPDGPVIEIPIDSFVAIKGKPL
jgi:hypothetical protein